MVVSGGTVRGKYYGDSSIYKQNLNENYKN